ncbi:tyrosine-type recombinase/integrase [Draconibacterium sediminis]|uniref:Tyr recombinase domain-containing protein n=1 Tax=Draconibacterium sediminis TaxID=1544798 RepID=A0A0D8J7J6_9BACT|nr:tyrosine-type recombinase/integrase [Draconibacterium sediminis]KJF42852.1 hypothetical protein LH29_15650 [Draconibacterium sediminis]
MGLICKLDYKKSKSSYSKNDSVSVVVVYYYDKRKLKIPTGISCMIKDWDDDWKTRQTKNPIKNTDELSKEKNIQIKQKLSEVNNLVFQLEKEDKVPSIDLVKSHLREMNVTKVRESLKEVHFLTLFELYEKWINSDLFPNRKSYVKTINPSIKDIKTYTLDYQLKNKVYLLPSDLTEEWVMGLIKWSYKKGLQPITIKKRVKTLVNFSNWCKDNHGTDFRIKKPSSFTPDGEREVIFLKREEVLKIFYFNDIEIGNPKHVELLTKHKCLFYIEEKFTNNREKEISRTFTTYEVYRDMLIFLCNVGCRFGDMVKMKVGDFVFDDTGIKGNRTGYFRFYMEKSRKRTEVKVKINQMTDRIFRKYSHDKNSHHYLFPRTNFGNPFSNQKFNKHTKHLGEILELNRPVKLPEFDLTGKIVERTNDIVPLHNVMVSHIGRRTFIREHIEKGTPIRTIMKMTGHSSQKVFDGYYNVLDKDIMKVNDDLFSDNLKKKYNNKENKPKKTKEVNITSPETEEQLKTLQQLNEKGVLPDEIYTEKVRQLMGL